MKNTHSLSKLILIISLAVVSSCLDIKGINFVSVPYTQASFSHQNAKLSLSHLKDTGANWISVPIAYFQEEKNASKMRNIKDSVSSKHRLFVTPSEKEINDVVTMAKNQDLKVMLMPVLEILKPGYVNSRHIGDHFSPYEFRRWFEFYTKHILELAQIAEENGAEMICIGHNLNVLSHQETYWLDLISKVRGVYTGLLTYSASSKNEFKKSGFWSKLDFVGIIADFEYKNHHELKGSEVQAAMTDFLRYIDYMAKVWKKPVIISRAYSHSAKDISNNRVQKITHQSQAIFYETLLQASQDNKNVKGIFWGDWVADHKFGGEKDGSLSPQFKPSELILRKFYGGEGVLPKKEGKSNSKMYCKDCHEESEIDL